MVKQVKNTNSYAASAQPQHHIAELADGRVGKNPFNIGHHQPYGGGKDSGKAADDGYRGHCLHRMRKEGEGAGDQENASRHHSSGMN